jgi:hypothetical protein
VRQLFVCRFPPAIRIREILQTLARSPLNFRVKTLSSVSKPALYRGVVTIPFTDNFITYMSEMANALRIDWEKRDYNIMGLIEQLKALDEQREKLIEDAKRSALDRAHKAISELNELGFTYSLSAAGRSPVPKAPKKSAAQAGHKRRLKDVDCPICHYKTSPMHDGRSHRGQSTKRPFTAAELAEKGLAVA